MRQFACGNERDNGKGDRDEKTTTRPNWGGQLDAIIANGLPRVTW